MNCLKLCFVSSLIFRATIHLQDRLRRAKALLLRASEKLDAFGHEPVASKARELDKVGENFMKRLDGRRDELAKAESFFRVAAEVTRLYCSVRGLFNANCKLSESHAFENRRHD